MSDGFDPWAFTSGLLDDVTVKVEDSFFAFDADYNDGETLLLKWEVSTDDDDQPTATLMYPCGKGWEPKDKGAKAAREDGKSKAFGKQSGIGQLASAAIEAGAGDVLRERGNPMEAAIWKGLSFHMKRKEIDYGGEIGKKERLLPTEFIQGASKSSASKAKAAPVEDDGDADAETPAASSAPVLKGALKVKLMKLAKEHDDYDSFVEAAYELDGVDGNAAAEAAIDDQDGGIFATVKAEG